VPLSGVPRQPRIDQPGFFYHVIARGIERRRLFRADRDYSDFVRRMAILFPETGIQCFAWSLMPNHLHLLLMAGLTRLGRVMQRLLTGYATSFNIRYRRAGHLFQNRFKAIVCQEDPYYLELVRYIHLNQVRAGIVKTPKELANFPWTGHAALMDIRRNNWQNVNAVLARFGANEQDARTRYGNFIEDGWTGGHRDDLEGGGLIRSLGGVSEAVRASREDRRELSDVRILGDGDFVEKVLQQSETAEKQKSFWQTFSLDSLIETLARCFGIPAESIREKRRDKKVSQAKSVLLFASTEWLGRSLTSMANYAQMSTGCASRARGRGKELAERMELAKTIERQKGVPLQNPSKNSVGVSTVSCVGC
jgi:putative transposase